MGSNAAVWIRTLLLTAVCALIPALAGCERRPDVAAGASAASTRPAEPRSVRPKAADDQDAPHSPRQLPRTGELRGWTKIEPVRLLTPGRGRLFNDREQNRIASTFRISLGARCAYVNEGLRAEVVFVEGATPEDAFGLFTSLSIGSLAPKRADGSMVATGQWRGEPAFWGWQGTRFVQVRLSSAAGEPSYDSARPLFERILFSVPAAEPPLLLRVLPPDIGSLRPWLVRSTTALAFANNATLRSVCNARLDDTLGLDGTAVLSIVAIQQEPAAANVLWVVEYPHPDAAAEAARRYTAKLRLTSDGLAVATRVEPPQGRFLLGTWTAGAEVRSPILPRLRAALPTGGTPAATQPVAMAR